MTTDQPAGFPTLMRTLILAAVSLMPFAPASAAAGWEAIDLDANHATVEAWYDTVHHTTWLAAPNPARMTWQDAVTWANGLDVLGSSDWRLPVLGNLVGAAVGNDPYPAVEAGELGRLWTSFATASERASQFPSLPASGFFGAWYGNGKMGDPSAAWALSMNMSNNYAENNALDVSKGLRLLAWAVHDGDLRMTASVPEPRESTLLIAGSLALVFMARRRRAAGALPGMA